MKYLLPIIFFIFSSAYAGTCTTTSRTNYSAGQVLTSASLNGDFNQLVTKVNSLDGGCVTDGTLEAASLNATDFAAVTNGIHQGCALSYVDANTVQVSKCILSVNGTFVKTTATNNVTWGCPSCSAEVVSTQYYVYAKTGSSGTTLNLLISTTAPGADGYDGSGNKALGKFYNDASSNISVSSIYSWMSSGFTSYEGRHSTPGVTVPMDSFTFSYGDTNATTVCASSPCTYLDQMGSASVSVSSIAKIGSGEYLITFPKPYTKIKCTGNVNTVSAPGYTRGAAAANSSSVILNSTTIVSPYLFTDSYGIIHCEGY